jgi:ligand-binding sensor domain-containing protein
LTVVEIFPISLRIWQSHFVRSLFVLLVLVANAKFLHAERVLDSNPDFLVENWLALDGIPESSALALAQTPDGYIWVGSPDGLLRFNGMDFTEVAPSTGMNRLQGVIVLLRTDQSGRLWVSSDTGIAFCDHGEWHAVNGSAGPARSFADDGKGTMFLGTFDGRVFAIKDSQVQSIEQPEGLYRSGVFCIRDCHDGGIWLANRSFVGRWTGQHWKRVGPAPSESIPLLAAPAREGGIWILTQGELRHCWADGTVTSHTRAGRAGLSEK